MAFDFEARWARARALMAEQGVAAMLVMKPANLAYLTGDGRPCALGLLTLDGPFVVAVPECDLPSVRDASAAPELRAFRSEEEMFHGVRDTITELGLTEAAIAVERNFFDAALFDVVRAHVLPDATIVSASPVMSALRMIKDDDEIGVMRRAAVVADLGMAAAVGAIRELTPETVVAGEAERAMRAAGAHGWASGTYVASGRRSSMAHGPASSKPIGAGDVVQVHVAPIVDGYTVDLCRTILPPAGAEIAQVDLGIYLEAQRAGIAAARPGAPLLGIDRAMAEVLERAGCSDRFLRPVFHGVGLEHEEAPIPGGHAVVHGEVAVEEVQAGMVLAIGNCGIYRDRYGVRVEDTVRIGPAGPEPLTGSPAEPVW